MVTPHRTLGNGARQGTAHGGLGTAAGGYDIITYRKWEYCGNSPNRQIDISLGIYEPIIIHGLQITTTYCKKDISTQSL